MEKKCKISLKRKLSWEVMQMICFVFPGDVTGADSYWCLIASKMPSSPKNFQKSPALFKLAALMCRKDLYLWIFHAFAKSVAL